MTKEEMLALLEELELAEDVKDPAGLLTALKAANNEAKTNREALETAQAQIAEFENQRGSVKSSAIEAQLKSAGVKDTARITKLMNLDSIDLDAEGKLINFDTQLDEVKSNYAELFDVKLRAKSVEQFDNKQAEAAPQTATQIQLAAVKANRK